MDVPLPSRTWSRPRGRMAGERDPILVGTRRIRTRIAASVHRRWRTFARLERWRGTIERWKRKRPHVQEVEKEAPRRLDRSVDRWPWPCPSCLAMERRSRKPTRKKGAVRHVGGKKAAEACDGRTSKAGKISPPYENTCPPTKATANRTSTKTSSENGKAAAPSHEWNAPCTNTELGNVAGRKMQLARGWRKWHGRKPMEEPEVGCAPSLPTPDAASGGDATPIQKNITVTTWNGQMRCNPNKHVQGDGYASPTIHV
eukprot:scaffold431_cov334-Pavlova_lutheri.AAC.52